jgi:hypothetical protein
MRNVIVLGSVALACIVAVACSSSSSDDEPVVTEDGGGIEGGATLPAVDSATAPPPEGPAGTGANTGLPCDVQALLENRCIACHDGKTAVAMLNYTDLVAKATADPTKTVAELSVIRMKDAANPMPPKPAAPPEADEIEIFEAWVMAGTPRETKACTDPPPDGGVGDGGMTDAGPIADAGDGGLVCTSGVFWNMANTPSPLMYPGRACNACHQLQGGPNLRVAGTVYTALNESDDCNGKGPPPQLTVVVTDATGKVFNLDVNAAGNFKLETMRPRAPFKAAVTDGTKTRAMLGTVTSGDCNSCHTAAGLNGAPGRILAP